MPRHADRVSANGCCPDFEPFLEGQTYRLALEDQYGFAVVTEVIDPELISNTRSHFAWPTARLPELRPEQFHHRLIVDDPF